MGNAVFSNRAAAPLASGITSGAASLTVSAGYGSLFPVAAGSQYFGAVIQKGPLDTDVREYIYCQRAAGSDTITILARGQEGSSAQSFAAGDVIARVVLAGEMATFVQREAETVMASAATVDLAASPTEDIEVTGSTGISSLGATAPIGSVRNVRWSNSSPGALTHGTSAGNPRLPLGLNMTPRQNERYTFRKNADGTWWLESHNAATAAMYGAIVESNATVSYWINGLPGKNVHFRIGAPTGFGASLAWEVAGLRVWQWNAVSRSDFALYNFDATGVTATRRFGLDANGNLVLDTGGCNAKAGFYFDANSGTSGVTPYPGTWSVNGAYRQNNIANMTPGQGDNSLIATYHQPGVESFIQFNQGGSGCYFRFNNSGLGTSNAGWTTHSEGKSKKDIRRLDRVRERVMGTPVVLFKRRADPEGRDVIGTIANAAERSNPEAIHFENGVSVEREVGRDDEGKPIMKRMRSRRKTRVADYDQFGMVALAGTQEHYRAIDALVARAERAEEALAKAIERIEKLEAACFSK